MLMPQRRALFESSWSALALRNGPEQWNPTDRRPISNPDSDLRGSGEQRSGPPRRRRADTRLRRPQLTYDQEADQFHYVWPTETSWPAEGAISVCATMDAPIGLAPSSFSLRRLRAERLTEAHLADLRRMDGDDRMMAPAGGVRTEAETAEYLDRNLAHWAEHGFGIWILREPASGRVVGRAGLRHLSVEGVNEVELAYALFPEFWGRGLATDAARACVTIGRDWLGLPSLVGLVLPANVASQRVLRKAALVQEREVMHAGVAHLLFRTD